MPTVVERSCDATAGRLQWKNGKNFVRFLNRIAFGEHFLKPFFMNAFA
jgi:hypothetical protein